MYAYINSCIHTYINSLACLHACIYTFIHTYIICMHSWMHAYVHAAYIQYDLPTSILCRTRPYLLFWYIDMTSPIFTFRLFVQTIDLCKTSGVFLIFIERTKEFFYVFLASGRGPLIISSSSICVRKIRWFIFSRML